MHTKVYKSLFLPTEICDHVPFRALEYIPHGFRPTTHRTISNEYSPFKVFKGLNYNCVSPHRMGIYYGEVLGVRIVRQWPVEAEYAEDYEVVWEYEGLYWRELMEAKRKELSEDLVIQTKHEAITTYNGPQKMYVWLTNPSL